jgi:hypothetical protein
MKGMRVCPLSEGRKILFFRRLPSAFWDVSLLAEKIAGSIIVV